MLFDIRPSSGGIGLVGNYGIYGHDRNVKTTKLQHQWLRVPMPSLTRTVAVSPLTTGTVASRLTSTTAEIWFQFFCSDLGDGLERCVGHQTNLALDTSSIVIEALSESSKNHFPHWHDVDI